MVSLLHGNFFNANLMQIGLQIMQLFLVSTANCWLRVSDFYSVIVHKYIQNTWTKHSLVGAQIPSTLPKARVARSHPSTIWTLFFPSNELEQKGMAQSEWGEERRGGSPAGRNSNRRQTGNERTASSWDNAAFRWYQEEKSAVVSLR